MPALSPGNQLLRQNVVHRVEDLLTNLGRIVIRPPTDHRAQVTDQCRLWCHFVVSDHLPNITPLAFWSLLPRVGRRPPALCRPVVFQRPLTDRAVARPAPQEGL